MPSKEYVVGRLVAMLGEYFDPSESVVATLGGQGLEVGVWRRAGILPENGWLVERSARRIRRLMANGESYHLLQGNLVRFPDIFRASHGLDAGLDLFHWDLCGTVEPKIEEISGVLPLLANGRGRILGVTVSDQRQNRNIQSFIFTQEICRMFYGQDWDRLRSDLLSAHRREAGFRVFDLEKAVLREAGTLMYLMLAFATVESATGRYRMSEQLHPLKAFLELWKGGAELDEFKRLFSAVCFIFMPMRIERYSYGSSLTGFRMRSYFMRLQTFARCLTLAEAIGRLVELIRSANSFMVNDEGRGRIVTWPVQRLTAVMVAPASDTEEAQGQEPIGGTSVMKTIAEIRQDFAPVLALPLPGINDSFEQLCQMAQEGSRAVQKAADLKALLKRVHAMTGEADDSVAASVEASVPPTVEPAGERSAPRQDMSPSAVKKRQQVLEMDKIRLEFLKAFKSGGKQALDERMAKAAKRLKIENYRHVLGAAYARSQGGFRGQFVARILAAGFASLDQLADLYVVDPDILRREMT